MYRKFLLVAAMMLIASVFFSQQSAKEQQKKQKSQGQKYNDYMYLMPYLELKTIDEQYLIQIKDIYQNAVAEKQQYQNKLYTLNQKLIELADAYDKGENNWREIARTTEEIYLVQKKMILINQKAIEEINTINVQKDKKIQKVIDDWIKQMKKNPEEVERFVEYINRRPHYQIHIEIRQQ